MPVRQRLASMSGSPDPFPETTLAHHRKEIYVEDDPVDIS